MNRRLIAAAFAVVLLASLSVGGGALAQGPPNDGAGEYTLEELRQDGRHYSVDSARIVPEESQVYWLEHRPVNKPWQDVSASSSGPKLGEDQTLRTNTIYLRTIHASDQPRTVNVTVVSWQEGERPIGNGSMVPAAVNQNVQHHTVTIEPGWTAAAIELPRHDETTQVTMWIEEHPETARWRFEHKSVAFTQTIPVNTWSDFVLYGAMFIIIPALAFGYVGSRKVHQMVEKAGEPPRHGFAYYAVITTLATVGLVYGIYRYVAEVIVTVPFILGAYIAVVYMGYTLATHTGNSRKKLFWRPRIEKIEAFTETKIPSIGSDESDKDLTFSEDMPLGEMRQFRVLDEGQAGMSFVRDGWMAFLARLKGGRAKVENADELRTRFPLFNSPWDEVFIVDPDADDLVDYKPPGLGLKKPEIESWQDLVVPAGVLAIAGLLAWQATQLYGATAWAALGLGIPYLIWKFAVTGKDSYVRIEPAPAALRPALASMLVMQLGYRDAQNLEDAEEFGWKALAQTDTEELETDRRRADAVLEGIFGGEFEADGADPEAAETKENDRAAADGGSSERDEDE